MAFDWKKTVSSVLPGLGAALGGPLGGVAAAAVANVLGVNKDDDEAIAQAIEVAGPALPEKLNEAYMAYTIELEKLAVEREKIAAGDRDSARQKEKETKDWFPKALAAVVVIAFFVMLFKLPKMDEIDGTQRDLFIMAAGALVAKFGDVFAYYFGSSAGSAQKTKILADRE